MSGRANIRIITQRIEAQKVKFWDRYAVRCWQWGLVGAESDWITLLTELKAHNNIQYVCGKSLRQLVIAGFTTTTTGHAKRTIFTISSKQTAALTVGNPKPMSCYLFIQTPVDDVLNYL